MKKHIFTFSLLFVPFLIQAQNVGIGTTSPVAKLNIVGNSSNPAIPGTSSNALFRLGVSSIEGIDFGKMGTVPYSAWIQAGFNGTASDPLTLQPMGGNVGIGTISPTYKLDLNGDMNLTGALRLNGNSGTAGQILTSNGNSAPTWSSAATSNGSGGLGFGAWGDCNSNSISEYSPVADPTAAEYDQFGYGVSISGNYAIVGAHGDDVGANLDQGSASIFQWNGSNWVFMQKITDGTGAANDQFGNSVSISGNYAIIGASYDDVAKGSASIFQYNGSNWVFMQKLMDATGTAGDFFGNSVSISGNYAIVGATQDDGAAGVDQGSASIYQWNGASWVLMQKITDGTGAANDLFGKSVSISGNYAIVGAFTDDGVAGADQGSASIYQWNGASWVLMQKITDGTGAANDQFGNSVSISGNYTIVGAASDAVGANVSQGSASIYKWNGSSWVLMQKITDAAGALGDQFGYSVSISGDYAIVGAYFDDVGANNQQGSASIYIRVGLGWQKLQYVTDPGGNANDLFGGSIAIDGGNQKFLIGAYVYAGGSGKVVFGKVK